MNKTIKYFPRFSRSIPVAKKNLRIYYGKGPVVIFGILLPFFFAFLIGREISSLQLISGLAGMAMWFTATSISPVIAPWETRTKTLERLISMPISIPEILWGDILASLVMSLCISTISIVAAFLILGLNLVYPLIFILGMTLAGLCFSAIGVLLSSLPTDTPADIMMLSTLVKFPVIFVSGIFIPTQNLPGWGAILAHLSPLTYLTDLMRYVFGGKGEPWIDLPVLLAFSTVFVLMAILAHRRTLPKRL